MNTNQTQSDDRLWDALARWEEAFQQGRDLPAEELCRDCPEIIDQLKDRIWALKRTAWMTKPTADEVAPEPQDTSDPTPKALGDYDLLERIGVGGMGQVFKGVHRKMGRIVTVKLLPRSQSAVWVQDEVTAAAKLSHPNTVMAFDADEADGIPFLVMEYTEGVDLHRHVQEHGPLPVEKAVDCILQAAHGLAHAHECGVIHRDVKPANLLRTTSGTVKVFDLGLAHIRAAQPQAAVGTPDFMAPEAALDPSKADARSDIYGLGCTLWFLLTGKPLYDGSTIIQKILAHRERSAPSLRKARPDAPEALDTIFRKMVAKRPEDRFASMAEVVSALRALQQPRSRRGWLWGLVLLIAVVPMMAWLVFYGRGKDTHATVAEPPKLRAFNLDFTATADADLKQFDGMADLGELRLTKTKIRDNGLDQLKGCAKLQFLDLNHTAIGDAGLEKLAGLTELHHLGLSGTKVTDQSLRHLTALKGLKHLNLDFTGIGDEGLDHLANLTALEDLRLTRTKITDDGLAKLKTLTRLKKIDLHHTAVTDDGLKHLAGLSLKEVGVSGTKVTAAGLKRVEKK
ncbi:MAG: protein kinase [Gemmataceae bacterium]|nr:protein kinase [Gemmataceae bacterium]